MEGGGGTRYFEAEQNENLFLLPCIVDTVVMSRWWFERSALDWTRMSSPGVHNVRDLSLPEIRFIIDLASLE